MSTVIKAGRIQGDSGNSVRSIAFSFDDMSRQADAYLKEVRQEAAKIVKQAEVEAQEIRQKAEQQGQQAALKAADQVLEEKVGKHLRTLVPAIEKAAVEVEQARHDWLNRWHQTAVHTACLIAERVIRREIEKHPEITLDLIRETLELAAGSDEIELHISQQDFAALGGQVESLATALKRIAPATVHADPQIEAGGCRVVTKFGSIDQQISTQLDRIQQELS